METAKEKNKALKGLSSLLSFFSKFPSIVAVIIVFILMIFLSDKFLQTSNIMNVLRQVSMTAIMAAGLSFVVISGGIDVSNSATVGLVNFLWVMLYVNYSIPTIPAALICLAVSLAVGACNGFLIAKVKVPPLIATYAFQSIMRGLILVISNAYPIYEVPAGIEWLANGYIFEVIPVPVLLMIGVFVIAWFVLKYTKFGRRIYACGGNPEAAHLSGIKVVKNRIFAYMVAHAAAWFAGLIATSRLNGGFTNTGLTWEFEALSACIIGGLSLSGGKGNVFGALFGSIFVGLIVNGMTLLNVNSYYQQMAKGAVLVLAIVIDILLNERKK